MAGDGTTNGTGQGREAIVSVRGLVVSFGGGRPVMNGLDIDIYRGEILGFVGASVAGK